MRVSAAFPALTPRVSAALSALVLCASAPAFAQAAPHWRLTAELRYENDAVAAPLSRVEQMLLGPRGTVYVRNRAASEVYVFDNQGRYARTIGRRGAGPGEFRDVRNMGWLGDSLWVLDGQFQRFTLYGGDGVHAQTRPPWRALRDSAGPFVHPQALLADGTVLAVQTFTAAMARAEHLTSYSVFRDARDGRPLGTVARVAWVDAMMVVPLGGGGQFQRLQPWPEKDLFAVSPQGDCVVVVRLPVSANSARGSYTLTALEPDGSVRWQRTHAVRPIEVTDEMVKAEIAEMTGPEVGRFFPSVEAERRAFARALYRPAFLPPVRTVVVGADGSIWLQREAAGKVDRWDVWDADGDFIAVAEVPSRTRLLAVSGSRAWGTEMDELDVPHIVRYRIVR